ncbi:hypothetical protein AB0H18_02945 [Streptomyces sp. NPDC020766]|uniref:hypothetical protein n=1 Tax=Streptomyces sp. NPDC020766 TaxID=3155011 RepID=UPI00340F308A
MAAAEQATPENGSGILDLSGISLEELRSMDGPDLTDSLEYLMSDLDDPYSVRVGGSNPSHVG